MWSWYLSRSETYCLFISLTIMGEKHRTWKTAVAISNAFNAFLPYLGLHHVMFHDVLQSTLCPQSIQCRVLEIRCLFAHLMLALILDCTEDQYHSVGPTLVDSGPSNSQLIGKHWEDIPIFYTPNLFRVRGTQPWLKRAWTRKEVATVIWFTMMSFTQLQVAESYKLQWNPMVCFKAAW